MTEQMAVIRGIRFGLRDVGRPVIWFQVECMDGGSLQVIESTEFKTFLQAFDAYELKNIEGKPCVVDVSDGLIKFVRPFR